MVPFHQREKVQTKSFLSDSHFAFPEGDPSLASLDLPHRSDLVGGVPHGLFGVLDVDVFGVFSGGFSPPCGNGVFTNPFGTSPFPELTATCALLQQNQRLLGPGSGLPDNFCEIFQNQPEAQERCGCEFPPTPPPVVTPVPVAAPTTPAPTDGSDVVPLGPFARFIAIIIDIFRLFFNTPSPMP